MKYHIFLTLFISSTVWAQSLQNLQKKIKIPVHCLQIKDFENQIPKNSTALSIDGILISKKLRKIFFLNKNTVLYSFTAAFGAGYSNGPKVQEGDNRTPEGTYYVEGKKSDSDFHKALKVSYPQTEDIQFAEQYQLSPGGDIMIHGLSNSLGSAANFTSVGYVINTQNWTKGCVAIRNDEIDQVFDFVKVGTKIEICPL